MMKKINRIKNGDPYTPNFIMGLLNQLIDNQNEMIHILESLPPLEDEVDHAQVLFDSEAYRMANDLIIAAEGQNGGEASGGDSNLSDQPAPAVLSEPTTEEKK